MTEVLNGVEFDASPFLGKHGPRPVPPLPFNAVVAYTKGGVFWATTDEVNLVMSSHHFGADNIRRILQTWDGSPEAAEIYEKENLVTLAITLAWFTSRLNEEPYHEIYDSIPRDNNS